ncbi:hypothetical protein ACQKKG_13195 [Brevundimonas sp. NPDC003935]|uniref:hypothetical protein n=1 Tax=unclassified Brevundimonas TaxID=2622653 RepID=UPI002896AA7C|nr:hypothetical protein [Brevundimonas sp.]
MRLLSKALAVGGVGLALTGSTALSPLPASRPGTLNAICGPAAGGALAGALLIGSAVAAPRVRPRPVRPRRIGLCFSTPDRRPLRPDASGLSLGA